MAVHSHFKFGLARSNAKGCHRPRKRAIQYAAASRFHHRRLWNTGSPAFAGDDTIVGASSR